MHTPTRLEPTVHVGQWIEDAEPLIPIRFTGRIVSITGDWIGFQYKEDITLYTQIHNVRLLTHLEVLLRRL